MQRLPSNALRAIVSSAIVSRGLDLSYLAESIKTEAFDRSMSRSEHPAHKSLESVDFEGGRDGLVR